MYLDHWLRGVFSKLMWAFIVGFMLYTINADAISAEWDRIKPAHVVQKSDVTQQDEDEIAQTLRKLRAIQDAISPYCEKAKVLCWHL